VDCNSDAAFTTTIVTTAASATVPVIINFPTERGKYLVCYRRNGTSFWYQLPNTDSSVGAPFTVIEAQLFFQATTTGFKVLDYHRNDTHSFGAISSSDDIYIVNSTDVCGIANAWNGTALATAPVFLNGTSDLTTNLTDFVASRSTNVTITKPTSGFYKICYRRSQSTKTNATNIAPFVKAGWYQLFNLGTTNGANTGFYVATGATKLLLACPRFNTTYRLRTGHVMTVGVQAVDANNNLVPFSATTFADTVTLEAVNSFSVGNLGAGCTAANAPSFGGTSANLVQYLIGGRAQFDVTSLSGCPSAGCQFRFTSSATGISASSTCTFGVLPTFVNALAVSANPGRCVVGTECVLRFAALHTDGEPAFTATDRVTFAITGDTGLTTTTTANGASISLADGGSFANGFFTVSLRFRSSLSSSPYGRSPHAASPHAASPHARLRPELPPYCRHASGLPERSGAAGRAPAREPPRPRPHAGHTVRLRG